MSEFKIGDKVVIKDNVPTTFRKGTKAEILDFDTKTIAMALICMEVGPDNKKSSFWIPAYHLEHEIVKNDFKVGEIVITNFDGFMRIAKINELTENGIAHLHFFEQHSVPIKSLSKHPGNICYGDEEKMLRMESENESLKKNIEELRKEKEEPSEIYVKRTLVLHEENQKLHKEVEKLKEEYESLKEQNDSVEKRLNNACTSYGSLSFENVSLFGQINSLKKQNDSLVQALHAEQEKYKDVCRMNVLLNDQVNHKEHIIKELRKSNSELAGSAIKKEEAESGPEFKVGDFIKVKGGRYLYPSDIAGKIIRVDANTDSSIGYIVKFPDEVVGRYYGEDLSLCRPWTPVPTQDLKVGDKVKVEFEGCVKTIHPDDPSEIGVSFINYRDIKQNTAVEYFLSEYVKKIEG